MHIAVLIDRDWTHPQAGGSGENLRQQVLEWAAQGHRVTLLTSSYPGASPVVREGATTIHRRGGPHTVFFHTILRMLRGRVRDADVVLEIINGVTFLTPLWLRRPAVHYIHHLSRGDQYVAQYGSLGSVAGLVLETLPLRLLYRRGRFLTVSEATKRQLVAVGIPAGGITVEFNGVRADHFAETPRAQVPTLISLGRIKRYKRIDLLLDLLERVPGARLEIVGRGEESGALEREIAERGLTDRVRLHGFVDEATKRRLLGTAWVHVIASSAEGWGMTAIEAAACGTPTVALGVGGLTESVQHERTGLLADDVEGMAAHVRRLVEDAELRERLGSQARERARGMTWQRTAATTLALLQDAVRGRPRY